MSVRDRFVRQSPSTSGEHPVLELVPMERRHLREVLVIENAVYPKPWTQRVFNEELDLMRRGERLYLVGRIGREVVGYGGLLFIDDAAHVTNVAVAPEWQHRGVATEMLLELAWRAREAGCAALTLEVRHTNSSAQALYRRFGFAPAGVRKRYYENTDDAIVMWCQDIQSDEFAERLRSIEATRP
jgi:ribosomal-protein-alanine N-acetyltransferase